MKKALVILTAVALTAALAIGGTLAWLTAQDTVTNTFTMGNVGITLDEAAVTKTGNTWANATPAARVKANTYENIYPGATLPKDPKVTVADTSEDCYVRMLVTINKSSQWDAIFTGVANLTTIFNGYDSTTWLYQGNTENTTANTRTYEFRYKEIVATPGALPALFTSITVPSSLTQTQLATLAGFQITVVAHAIQAQGFTTAALAWAEFPTT